MRGSILTILRYAKVSLTPLLVGGQEGPLIAGWLGPPLRCGTALRSASGRGLP